MNGPICGLSCSFRIELTLGRGPYSPEDGICKASSPWRTAVTVFFSALRGAHETAQVDANVSTDGHVTSSIAQIA